MMIAFLAAAIALIAPKEPLVITWDELVPEGEYSIDVEPLDHESGPSKQSGSSSTVAELDGAYIRMPGYMLPLDYTKKGKVRAFLLVPYYGACIHVPPPPPNQIVFVDTSHDPVESKGLWEPVWVIGTLSLKMNENDLGDAAYTLVLDKMLPYED